MEPLFAGYEGTPLAWTHPRQITGNEGMIASAAITRHNQKASHHATRTFAPRMLPFPTLSLRQLRSVLSLNFDNDSKNTIR